MLGLLHACAAVPVGDFTLASTAPNIIDVDIIERDVEGEFCRSHGFFSMQRFPPNGYALATEAAIAKVPGGEIITNATYRFVRKSRMGLVEVCGRVKGNVGKVR